MNALSNLYLYNQNYSILGDVAVLILCFVFGLLMNKTFVKHKHMMHVFYFAIFAMVISSATNIVRHVYLHATKGTVNQILLYAFNNSYYINLLILLFLYIYYIVWSVGLNKTKRTVLLSSSGICFVGCCVLTLISNLTKFGTVIAENGDSLQTIITPFDIFYGYCIIVIFTLLHKYKSNVIRQVRQSLLSVELLCFLIYVVQKTHFDNSIAVLSFLIPIIALLFLQHSNAYDMDTGALDADSFDILMAERQKHSSVYSFMILKWYPKENEQIPSALKRVLYNFWDGFFHEADVFMLSDNLYALVIKEAKQSSDAIESKVYELIRGKFQIYYDQFHVDYKLQVLLHDHSCFDLKSFLHTISYFLEKQEINSLLTITDKMIDDLHKNDYILRELIDINKKCDLQDPRVLAYCQPVKDTKTGSFTSAEALMRLNLPDLGFIFPDQFIPIAERNGLIHVLSLIILNKVCMSVKKILDQDYYLERISVNFSVLELRHPDFCNEILNIIKNNDIPYQTIAIELTESENDTDYQNMINKVNVLKKEGLKFYLDDFGTGYSNFDRILDLGLDIVKFDRSLLLYANQNTQTRFMIEKFSEIFRQLNYKILFEGVEDEDQENLCLSGNADFLQGYLYSKPVPIEQLTNFLSKS